VKFVTEAFAKGAQELLKWSEGFLKIGRDLASALLDVSSVFASAIDSVNTLISPLKFIVEALLNVGDMFLRIPGELAKSLGLGSLFGGGGVSEGAQTLAARLAEAADKLRQVDVDLSGMRHSLQDATTAQNNSAKSLDGFFDSLKQVKGADIAAAFGNVKDAAAAVAARLPTFDDAVGATSQALQTLREPAPFVRDAMKMLGRGFDNTLTKLGVSRDSLMKFAEKVTYAQSITGKFADAAGGFTDLLHSALNDSGSYIVKGANSAAQALMDILQPLGWTKDAVESFGAQLNAHKNFKQQLIDNAMSDWDRVAKQRLQYYINQGANPFAAFHAMYGERQKMLEGITAEVDAAEKAWIKATGGLTGQMDITAEGVKLAGEEITKKLAAAGDAAKKGIEKATGFIKDLFGFGEGADVPSLDLPDPTEELEKQTPILERVARAAEGFGDDFLMATIVY
jgi:hypothetical protein